MRVEQHETCALARFYLARAWKEVAAGWDIIREAHDALKGQSDASKVQRKG